MPELPEVETICRSLQEKINHKAIREIICYHPDVLMNFANAPLTNWRIEDIRRRGKYLLFDLSRNMITSEAPVEQTDSVLSKPLVPTVQTDSSPQNPKTLTAQEKFPQNQPTDPLAKPVEKITMLIHLRMTGKLLLENPKMPPAKHTHVRFALESGMNLDFNDVRRFGRIKLFDSEQVITDHGYLTLGPEPLGENFTADYLIDQSKRHANSTIKGLLLNQTVIAGLGNIYVDESLFRAGIKPNRRAGKISKKRLILLQQKIREVIQDAIGHRGTSFRDYVDGLGKKGNFQIELAVYRRTGEPCPKCGATVKKIKIAGRSTHYCPNCQH